MTGRYWEDRFARILFVLGITVFALWTGAETWDTTREGTTSTSTGAITNSTNAGQIDDHIRADRQEVRYRAETEHCFGPTGTGRCEDGTGTEDNGRHRAGSARCFFQSSAPTTLPIADYDASARASQDGSNALDYGRCWLDNDSMTLYIYDLANTAWRPLLRTSGNLLYGGSFEQTDGTGNDSTADGAPGGWSLNDTPSIDYADAPASNGGGKYVQITGSGAASEGISQTLTAAGLKPSTTYLLVGRMYQTSGDDCSFDTLNGGTDVALATTGDDAWESVAGYFTTDSTPTAVTVKALADASLDVCLFDRLGVFEMGDRTWFPDGVLHLFNNDSSTADTSCTSAFEGSTACDDLAQVTARVPGIGYMAQIYGQVTVEPQDASNPCKMRIAKADTTHLSQTESSELSGAGANSTISTSAIDGPLTANDTIVYEMDVAGNGDTNCDLVCGEAPNCKLDVLLIPPR